jgi:2-succinyl-6-hydroxy-2,4-cyclohexadiene-1-carboxylate synthase
MGEPIVLLHGFSGTHRTWDRVVALLDGERYRPLAVDLRGHGAARDRRPIGFAECVADVLEGAPERFALCGYSMGGRIALHVALAAPERVTRLVLVGATAGLDDPGERAARRERDEALAARVERGTVEEFAATWRAQPLFDGDPEWLGEQARADQRRNDPAALAAVLRGLGTGVMEPVWDRLGELAMPVALIAGERDVKFRALAERLAAGLQRPSIVVVPGAGHAAHLEDPAAVVAVITER